MYENMTFSRLIHDTLQRISDKYDKRQGSIIYDAIAPVCAELTQAYIELDRVLQEGFADTSSREYLIKRAMERGLSPYPATHSIILAEFLGNMKLKGGERFNLDEFNYFYTGEKEGTYYKLKCEKAGIKGNISYGELLPIDNITGLETANVIKILTAGKDEEDTESFRQRYLKSFKTQAFGGNRADYINKVKELNSLSKVLNNGGVGGCKVYRTPNGGGSVEVFITNNMYTKPTDTLIKIVQEEVDPLQFSGEGFGIAPIGHFVTVKAVHTIFVNVSFTVELKPTFVLDDINKFIEEIIEEYLIELRKSWENEDNLIIRISKIEALILSINGVIDIRNTKINGAYQNFVVAENMIPLRGNIDVTI